MSAHLFRFIAAPRTASAKHFHSNGFKHAPPASEVSQQLNKTLPPPVPLPPVHHQQGAGAAHHASLACTSRSVRTDWTRDEIASIYNSKVMDLLFYGSLVHRHFHNPLAVQQCTLLSIKTGGCSEDCSYCPQSSKYKTPVSASPLLREDKVLEAARAAKEQGSTRFCMGAAWRSTHGRNTNFKQILNYVTQIRGMGLEVCCTLGMLDEKQAKELKSAGLSAYNHNLDTSRSYYPKIITTRSYDDRLETIGHVRDAGISVCSGGIIGLGESTTDRIDMLHTLSTFPKHPESVPINALVPVKGTPLEKQPPIPVWDMVRMIATARIVMPKSMVRLSAGRVNLSVQDQALCFLVGANSIFTGQKLLTTANNEFNNDQHMFDTLGLVGLEPNLEKIADLADDIFLNLQSTLLHFSTSLHNGLDQISHTGPETYTARISERIRDVDILCDRMLMDLGPGAEIEAITTDVDHTDTTTCTSSSPQDDPSPPQSTSSILLSAFNLDVPSHLGPSPPSPNAPNPMDHDCTPDIDTIHNITGDNTATQDNFMDMLVD